MKKALLFLFSLLIGVGLFYGVGRIVGWEGVKTALVVFSGWQGLAIFGLTILMALVGNWKWKVILKSQGVSISFRELLRPYLAGFSIMFLLPMTLFGGELFRGYVLRERNSVPWSKGMASIIIDRISEWTTNLVVIFFGGAIFLLTIGLPPKNLAIIFGGALLFFVGGISYFYFKSFKKESIFGPFVRMNHGRTLEIEKEIFKFFKPRKKLMWQGFALSFLRGGVMWLRAGILITFLVGNMGVWPALSVLGFNYLAVMIPIPTALGSHEAIQAFAFNALGPGAGVGTAFTMIIRGAELLLALFGIIILFRLGIGLLETTLFRKIQNFVNNRQ